MRNSYTDIRSRISSPPFWWDENAVPRYGDFDPRYIPNIYANECVLFLITCQACGRAYQVCMSGRHPLLAEKIGAKTLRYGDPPNACDDDCLSGASMTSEPRRVLGYWHRPLEVDGKLNGKWVRDPELEVEITPEWLESHLGGI